LAVLFGLSVDRYNAQIFPITKSHVRAKSTATTISPSTSNDDDNTNNNDEEAAVDVELERE
jgi:hypothetical protein